MMTPTGSLVDCLNQEATAVTGGQAQVCGASHFGQNDGVSCMRVSTHAEDGEYAREAHAYHVTSGGDDYWVTWSNPPA